MRCSCILINGQKMAEYPRLSMPGISRIFFPGNRVSEMTISVLLPTKALFLCATMYCICRCSFIFSNNLIDFCCNTPSCLHEFAFKECLCCFSFLLNPIRVGTDLYLL